MYTYVRIRVCVRKAPEASRRVINVMTLTNNNNGLALLGMRRPQVPAALHTHAPARASLYIYDRV